MSEQKTAKIISAAIGRRKEAVASVRLIQGAGEITVNGKPVSEYFPGLTFKSRYTLPFTVTSSTKYSVTAKISGGGLSSQVDALVLGISRALTNIKSDHKTALRSSSLLTRDPRERQRRMVGTGGKARRKKQSPKR
jgi:small subunit ribosomal protein S9